MYKKIFAAMLVALFLIVSVAVISATDSIPVKAVWNGDEGDIITVNLLKDGHVVDTVNLTSANSWKTAFDIDDGDGSYNISVVESKDFSSSVNGTADTGFVVSCSLTGDVLKATEDDSSVEGTSQDDSSVEGTSQDDNSSEEVNVVLGTTATVNGTANNNTNSNATTASNSTSGDNNSTGSDKTDDKKDDSPSKEKTTTTTTKTTKTTKVVTKEAKKDKKPNNKTKTIMDSTGFPIIVLVIAIFVAVLVPLLRKK